MKKNQPPGLGETQPPTEVNSDSNPGANPGHLTPAGMETQAPEAADNPAGNPPASAPKGQQKTLQLGDFRLIKKLGQGGMGAVFMAHQISLDRPVALKVMAKHLAADQRFVARFTREARIMAKLQHPNIVQCYAVGQDRGHHYLAMEFIDGKSVEGWRQKQGGKLSVPDAVHILLASARALEYAHGLQMVHRDIKPDNILLSNKGEVKVADMGLAKALDENMSLTQSGTAAGTPFFMAPEQAANAKHADGRSDIYSLGCTLYQLLTGELPFTGESNIEVFKAKEAGQFRPARKLNSEVPERLDWILDKMMARKPEHRYADCTALIKDLEALGIAAETLSFIDDPAAPPMVPAPRSVAPVKASPKTKPGLQETVAPSPAPPKPKEDDWWYIMYTTSEGRTVTHKLKLHQVLEMVRSPHFDLEAQASRHPKTGFRGIATYKEFQPALQGRLAKAKADRKTSKVRSLYDKIGEEEDQAKKRKFWKKLKESMSSGVGLLAWLLVLGTVFGLAVWGLGYAVGWWGR